MTAYDPLTFKTLVAENGQSARKFYSPNKLVVDMAAAGFIDLRKQDLAPSDTDALWLDLTLPEEDPAALKWYDPEAFSWVPMTPTGFGRHIIDPLNTQYQPLDSDLTAIAALTTTPYGRSLLTLADGSALGDLIDSEFLTEAEAAAAYQPLDADLTAIAALTTTAYGRALLALADGNALAALVDANFLTPAEGNAAYQPLDSDLTAIAGLSPSNDDIVQRKAGVWTNRTMAQLIADLAALGTTFQPLDSDLTAIAALTTSTYGRALLTLADGNALAALVDANFLTPAEGNAAYQPLDADLTAIASLTTAAYGRGLLTLANAAALAAEVDSFFLTPTEGNAAYQPLDSDLTAIAALTTTAYGRALLELANAAALKTAAGIPTTTTDNAVARFDGAAGSTQNSGVIVDDSNNVSGVNNLTAEGYFDIPEISAPANPSSNRLRIYSKDNGSGLTKGYLRDSAGNETEIGSGGSSGGVTSLASGSLSGAAVDVTNIPATYSYLYIVITGGSSSSGAVFNVQLSVNNGSSFDTTAANYIGFNISGTTVTANNAATIGSNDTVASGGTATLAVSLFGYAASGRKLAIFEQSESSTHFTGLNAWTGTGVVNAIRLAVSAGTWDAGTYELFGVA